MMATSAPLTCLKRCAERFCVLPGLMAPKLSFPGFLRAAATTSWRVLSGESALTASSISKRAVIETKVKSVSTLLGPHLEQRHADGLPVADHAERVSVLRRLEHRLGGQQAAGSRAIFDHDLLLGALCEFLREQPHGEIRNAACAIRNGHVNAL